MKHVTALNLALLLLSLSSLGCGDEDNLSEVLSCDIASSECQDAIFQSVADFTEFDGPTTPVRTISVEQYEEELRESFSGSMTDGSDPITRGLKLAGIIPQEMQSSAEARIQFLVSWVHAYYRSQTASITVIDRSYSDVAGQNLLAHEFVHAIQDAQFGLNTLESTTTDESIAVRSVIEGDANHIADRWTIRELLDARNGIDPNREREAVFEQYNSREKAWLNTVADSIEALQVVEQEFPYAFGFEFMAKLYENEGLSSRKNIFETPPATALALIFGAEDYLGGAVPMTTFVESAHPAPVEGFEQQSVDTLGAVYLYAYLRRGGASEIGAWSDAALWRGDRWAIFSGSERVVVAWTILLSTDDTDVTSRIAASLNEYGESLGWGVETQGNRIYVVAAESTTDLTTWLDAL